MALTKIDDRGLNTPIDLLDNEKIRFGDATTPDTEIYHNGTHTYINHVGTGDLILQTETNGDDIKIYAKDDIYINPQGGENGLTLLGDGAVQLFYDGSGTPKLETTSEGTQTTGRSIIYYGGNAGKPTLLIGADNEQGSTSLTNATQKACRVGMPHYTNAEEPTNMFHGVSGDGIAEVRYGGGTSYMNAATSHRFYTAANTTTTSGTERLHIDSNGRILIADAATAANTPMEVFGSAVLQLATTAGGSIILGRNDTSVATDNNIGGIYWDCNDSSGDAWNDVARISCIADGGHADGDYPSRLEFYTTADGEATVTERLRITSGGKVLIGTDNTAGIHSQSGAAGLRVKSGTVGSNYGQGVISLMGSGGDFYAMTMRDSANNGWGLLPLFSPSVDRFSIGYYDSEASPLLIKLFSHLMNMET